MEKERLEALYSELGDSNINTLYEYSCLILSGFDKDLAYDLIDLLNDLWLKDEANASLGELSDMLYDNYLDVKDKKLTTRELLVRLYNNYNSEDDEDEDYDF